MASNRALTATRYRWLAYALFLLTLYGSLIPLRYQPMPVAEALERFRSLRSFDPAIVEARGDWLVNMVQYAALSFCFMGALGVDRRWPVALAAAAVVVPFCAITALVLEFLQVYFPFRTVSLNDLVVEAVGGVAGALIWLGFGQQLTDWSRRFWNAKGVAGLAAQLLPAYLVVLLIAQLMPFDVVMSWGEIARKYHAGRIHLLPFGDLLAGDGWAVVKILTNAGSLLPFGILVGLASPRARRWPELLGLGLAVALLIEGLQFFVYTRYCDATDVVTGAAAVLLGGWLVGALRGSRVTAWVREHFWHATVGIGPGVPGTRRAVAWVLLFGFWAGTLAVMSWQPFDFTADPARFDRADGSLTDENTSRFGLRRMAWAPFIDYYWGSRYDALDQFVRRSLSFVPLGVLMALARRRSAGAGAVVPLVLVALAVGAAIEAGQFFIPDRHPSTTDLIIAVFGAWAGFAATRHGARALGREARLAAGAGLSQGRDHVRGPERSMSGRA